MRNSLGWFVFAVSSLIFLGGCDAAQPRSSELDITKILGQSEQSDFLKADRVRPLQFPADLASHPSYRNEWWYLTGNLDDAANRQFGYQLTFFRTGIKPPSDDVNPIQSAWHGDGIWMAHLAITDVEAERHESADRFSRENPGLAGAEINPLRIWLEDWSIESQTNDFPWRVKARVGELQLDLQLNSSKPRVLHGDQGFSRKSNRSDSASYYYSYTRLQTDGVLMIASDRFEVSGQSWFDREWSTSVLDRSQSGWDWFSIQFADGRDLMYFQMRQDVASTTPDSRGEGKLADIHDQKVAEGQSLVDIHEQKVAEGSLVDIHGRKVAVSQDDVQLQERRHFRSPTGICYPIEWTMKYLPSGEAWLIKALVDDQYMDLAVKYWEGAVNVLDATTGEQFGRGFLEMTRFGHPGNTACNP